MNIGSWDVGKIYRTFEFDEAKTILSIPINGDSLERRIWHFKANGRYMVKSGYLVTLEFRNLINLNVSHVPLVSQQRMFWKHLRKLKLPTKDSSFYLETRS